MAYFRSDNNIFCGSITSEVKAGATVGDIRPRKNFRTPVSPFRLSDVAIRFGSAASGSVNIVAIKDGTEFLVRSQNLEGSTTCVITGIGLWMGGSDSVKISNNTGVNATVVVDFTY